MIAHIRGRILAKAPNQVIVECGGVGYDVTIAVPTFSELPEAGNEAALYIYTHVREDQISLFGFLRPEEKLLFEKLISVSGIGPTLAIKMLSGIDAREIVGFIQRGDVARLTKLPGIGKKIAERTVLELKDKLKMFGATPEQPVMLTSAIEEDVLSALVNLGFQRAAAEKALAAEGPAKGRSFEELFRATMASLSK